jgi:hypothetical protein
MAYVCEQLSTPAPITGIKSCQVWALETSNSILPTLTTADRDSMIIFCLSCFAVVFTVQMLRKLFGT